MKLNKIVLPAAIVAVLLAFKKFAGNVDISNQFSIAPGGINFKQSKPGFFSTIIYPEIEVTNPTNSSTVIDSISGSLLANGNTVGSYYLSNIAINPGINTIKLPTKISTISTLSTLINYFTKGTGSPVTLGTTGIMNKGAFNYKFNETYNIKPGIGINGITGLPWVEVIFKDKKFNYSTSVSPTASIESIKKYFIGNIFNVGKYPKENLQKCINVIYHKDI